MLFDMIEQVSDDVNDPYHYPTIRVLVSCSPLVQSSVNSINPFCSWSLMSNSWLLRMILVMARPGYLSPTKSSRCCLHMGVATRLLGRTLFCCSIEKVPSFLTPSLARLTVRPDETSLQLLTLKLLYLLFTTPPTYEYFYTNDLHVLVDILVRNLLDLPEEASALRHTYLRVLYPLLEHTQLQYPPHYKREEIRKLLTVLGGGQISDPSDEHDSLGLWSHFDDVDETTKRLVRRCQGVSWLTDPETEARVQAESPTETEASTPSSSTSPLKSHPPALPAPRKLKKRNSSKASTLTIDQYLAPQFELARKSSHSMMEVAAQMEKPGVITPSRNPSLKHNLRAASAAIMNKKEKPPPPKARRSGWTRPKGPRLATDVEIAKAGIVEIEAKFNTDSRSKELSDEERSSERASESNVGHAHVHSLRSPFKKPPPAPKARRWRGKRAKEEGDGAGGADREPGKFNSQLSSVVTTIDDKAVEVSPFSPVETTFVPPENGIVERQPKSSVREALAEAHGQALADITETLEHAHLTVPEQAESAVELEREEEPGLADQDHLHDNLLRQQLPHTITPEARVILTPPGQAPPRAVPGPRWELERSPFLTDEEDPESEGGPDVDADAHVGLHAEAESPHGGTKIEETVGAS